ncbi:UDP-N-acetylmuramate--L-alanine ligase [Neolewinella aurantiaca]|uniref:UDP-N-acetylmuramate--L-alanine ligase n=1 Tax=Neolewinella aurantiaca TaxID=2602767 RepID=A0A5C7FIL0_9BACT|nr:UDP-N-acetylmuramate--L-alanine ligase [Neolewinella aurantiaca]TXF89631.1 UDP-N-acetylmuramate--L-alanine ligase [Neolewinella aurantiaca]
MELTDIKQVYFIGVGGIGMSAVARYFNSQGLKVTGYDKTETPLTRALEAEGIAIHYGAANVSLVPDASDDLLVVWTPAIPTDFAELVKVQAGNYNLYKRAQVLGLLSRGMDCVGIAGTHGKTTTTTITTHLMMTAGLQPHAFLGGIPRDFDGNYVHGNSNWVVVEADEYDRSFLNLDPAIAVILSADPDHLDIYGDHDNMLETGFRAYARRVKEGGSLIVRYDIAHHFSPPPPKGGARLTPPLGGEGLYTFGIGAGDFCAHNVRVEDGAFHFDLKEPDGHLITNIRTALPGRHNVENAVAACAVTRLAGGSEDALKAGLSAFRGIARRFETVLKTNKIVIIDDYAHHPTELEAAITAARELYPDQTIRGVFQPHLFSRTQDFAQGFAKALDLLDEAILIPIYPARELPIEGVTSRLIFGKMRSTNKRLLDDEQMLAATAELTDGVLLLLGAGNIDALVPKIVAEHQNTLTNG